MNDSNYKSTIIINIMGYKEDFEPPTKKIKVRAMPVNKENDYNPVVKRRSIIIEEDEEPEIRLIRKRKRKN
jgi:hypothetical protein